MDSPPKTADGYPVHVGDYVWTITGRKVKRRQVSRISLGGFLAMGPEASLACTWRSNFTWKLEENAEAALVEAMRNEQ